MPRGTTLRNVRVEDDLWVPAKAKAGALGVTLSDVIREALADFVQAE